MSDYVTCFNTSHVKVQSLLHSTIGYVCRVSIHHMLRFSGVTTIIGGTVTTFQYITC